jgi:hypothetical protein
LVGLIMRILSLSFFLTLIFYNTAHALPKCEGDDDSKWTNCKGAYLQKDTSKPGDENKFTRDFIGEFGNTPGIRHGKGISKVYKDGKLRSIFTGNFKDDKTHGQGSDIRADGKMSTVGEYKEGLIVQGTFKFPSGSIYIGSFKDTDKGNGRSGIGTMTYDDGNKYFGEWKDDLRSGVGTYTWADGKRKYVGEWKDDKFNGHGNINLHDGNNYVGGWKDDKKHGQGTFTWGNGSKYIGEWKNDLRNGQGTYTANLGDKYVGEFKDAKFHGQGTYTWADGKRKYVGEWKSDKFHGQGTFTNTDGTKDEGKWNNNELVK